MRTNPERTFATELTPLWDREEEWRRRLEMIQRSKRTLYISTYYIDHDRFGIEFLDTLGAACKRGVFVVLLIDSFGQRLGTTQMSERDRATLTSRLRSLEALSGRVLMYRPRRRIDRIEGGG